MSNETRTYSDGTTATGLAPLPVQSPAQQDNETGPCDKCQGSGTLLDRRVSGAICDECHGHGWFNSGVAGPAHDAPHEWLCAIHRGGKCTCSVLDAPSPILQPTEQAPYCAKQIALCRDGCNAIKVTGCGPDTWHGDCWRVRAC